MAAEEAGSARQRLPGGAGVSGGIGVLGGIGRRVFVGRWRVVGVVVALVVVGGLTGYLAWPRAAATATTADRPGGLYASGAVASRRVHAAPPASTGARPPGLGSVPPATSAVALGSAPPAASAAANPAGNNLALGKPTAASSTEANSWDAANAVDGDTGTRWGSQWSDPQWIRVDLGGRWSVSAVTLRWGTAYATRFTIQTSTDGSTWTVVKAVDDGNGGVESLSFAAVPARYVMMFGTHRSGGYGYELWELEIR